MWYLRRTNFVALVKPAKQVRNTHPKKSITSTSKAFELLHMDLFRLTQYTSIGGNKYGFCDSG